MSTSIAKAELKSITDFQKKMHVISEKGEEISSLFFRKFVKSTWYSCIPAKLKSYLDGDDVIYEVNNIFHFLLYTYLRFKLPSVRVRPEYKGKVRIRWTHNVGTAPIKNAVFTENDEPYQSFDNVWCDIYAQFYQEKGSGKRKAHNIGVGNVQCMESWTEFLPEYPINVDQPWFYGMDHSLAFPIFYKHSQTRALHRYTYRRRIFDFLCVEMLDDNNEWKSVNKKIKKYVDVNGPSILKIPELWGRYAYVTDPEIAFYKCGTERNFYIRDVVSCDIENPDSYGDNSQIKLDCESPCVAFFWVAENQNAIKKRCFSNYTTDEDDVYSGWDPIKTTTLKYGTLKRWDDMESDHFSISEPRKHFKSSPIEKGYHAYSYAWDSVGCDAEIGITLSNMRAILSCKLGNTNLFYIPQKDLSKENIENENKESDQKVKTTEIIKNPNDPTFITKVRLLVVKRFTVTGADDNYNFHIE